MHVLVAHEEATARHRLAEALRPLGVEVGHAEDGTQALEALLASDPPRIALLDWDLPHVEGPELCRLVRDFHVEGPPFVLLLAGSAHHHEVEAGLSAGADDCVRVPASPAEILARVELARRHAELAGGRDGRAAEAWVPLPGVLDRAETVQRLEAELARARRDRDDLSIGVLDVDGLDGVNERHGRAAGDKVLRDLVGRLRLLLRPYDSIGRLCSDEFLLILSRSSSQDLGEVLGRVREAVAAEPFESGRGPLAVTVSLGGATGREESAGQLIVKARRALAEAGAAGPDTVVAGSRPRLAAIILPE